MEEKIIELKNISKSFGATRALSDVSFGIKKGSVHALIGENGAGKSTLMKILMGIHQPDQGEVVLAGEAVTVLDPVAALGMGLAIVFQEITMCGNLSVRENMFLGRELTRRGNLDIRAMRERTRAALDEVGLKLSPDQLVETLSVAQKQLVQIGRAILTEPRVLILDEPTSSLTRDGVDSLFRIVRRLHERGVTVLYISHKMEEIFEIADTATVLKDGKHVNTVAVESVGVDDLVAMMVGRELDRSKRRLECRAGGCLLEVQDLAGDGFAGVSLRVAAGEIVGIAGLVGSGRTELIETIFGVRPATAGRILLKGKEVTRSSVLGRIRAGMSLVPEDRQLEGLIFTMVLRENLTLPDLALGTLGRVAIDGRAQRERAGAALAKMRVTASSMEAEVDSLSGGNQQKIVIGKWLSLEPSLLILDEPTRGIDVGAKAEVHDFIKALADEGRACLVVSSELPEVLALADRIYVMHMGELKGEVSGESATEEQIMGIALAGGGQEVRLEA
ncbi:MAG TPA: sugar ABC transporter ATP-binding protein [bacterium]|nr:sugar ABC transporter ATP-binding protein [bacterium]